MILQRYSAYLNCIQLFGVASIRGGEIVVSVKLVCISKRRKVYLMKKIFIIYIYSEIAIFQMPMNLLIFSILYNFKIIVTYVNPWSNSSEDAYPKTHK